MQNTNTPNIMSNTTLTPAAASFIADVSRMATANLAKYKAWGWTAADSGAVREMARLQKAANDATA